LNEEDLEEAKGVDEIGEDEDLDNLPLVDGTGGEEDLSGEALITAHKVAKRRLRLLRMVFPLVVILVVVLNFYGVIGQVKDVDTDVLITELERQADRLWPHVEDHLAEVAAEVQPILAAALAEQSAIMGPRIERRVAASAEAFKVNVEKDFIKAVEKSLEEIDRRQRQVLMDEIPALEGDRAAQDTIMAALREALVKWAMHELTTTFHQHMVALEKIRKTLQSSYMAPAGAKANPEDALLLWLDLMNEKIGGEGTILGDEISDDDDTSGAKKRRRKRGKKTSEQTP
jgi:hypothetical protein